MHLYPESLNRPIISDGPLCLGRECPVSGRANTIFVPVVLIWARHRPPLIPFKIRSIGTGKLEAIHNGMIYYLTENEDGDWVLNTRKIEV